MKDFEAYQASCGNFEEVASNNGAKKLGDPVEDASKDGDLASESQTEGDSWINMAAGDIGTD